MEPIFQGQDVNESMGTGRFEADLFPLQPRQDDEDHSLELAGSDLLLGC